MKYANLPPEKRIEHYEWNFQAHLGSGSFAKVYLGRDINSKELIAIKILDANLMKDDYMKNTLNNEVHILKRDLLIILCIAAARVLCPIGLLAWRLVVRFSKRLLLCMRVLRITRL